MKNSKRGFAALVLLIIIAIIAIGVGAYYYSQKSSSPQRVSTVSTDTSKPKLYTYKNSKYGFETSYPETWLTEDYAGSDLFAVNFTPVKNSTQIISIQVFDNSKNLSLQDWISDYLKKFYTGPSFSNTKEIKINNVLGLRGIWSGGASEASSPTVFLSNDKKIYMVSQAKLTTKPEPDYDEVFEEMLSSLKLTQAVITTEADIVGCYAGTLNGQAYMAFSKDNLYQTWNPENQPSPAENGIWDLDKTGGLTYRLDIPDEKPQIFTSVVRQGDTLILNDPQFGEITLFKKECN